MSNPPAIAGVVLAAGQGKRMRSEKPKVLHEVCGEAMIDHVLRAIGAAGADRTYVVTGHLGEQVQAHLGDRAQCIDQPERLGTGHAVMMAGPALADFTGNVLVAYGDMPLIKAETYRKLVETQQATGAACVMLTALLDPPRGYGRIIRDSAGRFERIVEEKDCTPEQAAIREVNTGLYVFDGPLLFAALKRVGNTNAQREYYLTDVPEILLKDGHVVESVITPDQVEILGVNSREQLAEVASLLRHRLLREVMDSGVTVIDPATTWIEHDVEIGHDAVIEPFTILRRGTKIGAGAHVGPYAELRGAFVTPGARVEAGTH